MFGHQWEHCRTLLWDCACGFWGFGALVCVNGLSSFWVIALFLSGGSRIPISVEDSQQKSCRWIEGCLYLRLVGAPLAFMWWILASGPLEGWVWWTDGHAEENPQRCVVGVTGSSQKSWCFLDRGQITKCSRRKPLQWWDISRWCWLFCGTADGQDTLHIESRWWKSTKSCVPEPSCP